MSVCEGVCVYVCVCVGVCLQARLYSRRRCTCDVTFVYPADPLWLPQEDS